MHIQLSITVTRVCRQLPPLEAYVEILPRDPLRYSIGKKYVLFTHTVAANANCISWNLNYKIHSL